MNHLSYSQCRTSQTCRRQYYYSHELDIRPSLPAKPLRMGSAYHEGLAILGMTESGLGVDLPLAMQAAQDSHNQYDIDDGGIELTTILCLLSGYQQQWGDRSMAAVEVEGEFTVPLRNPKTGRPSRTTRLKGRFDAIVEVDGRLLVKESKLTGSGIAVGSPMRDCLETDAQGSLYVLAAREAGHNVCGVLWDLTAQPTIKPTPVPVLDGDGLKVVEDVNGYRVLLKNGKPRQAADKKAGQTLRTRPMRADEWSYKLITHIGANPDHYYARIEVPRLGDELDRVQAELWELQRTIREARKRGAWYRTCSHTVCGRCDYRPLCLQNFGPGDTLPGGFEYQQEKNN